MPWCGFWGMAYWWVLPLIGLVVMAVMFFACSRGFGCMGRRRHSSAESDLRQDIETLKKDVRKLARQPG